MTMSMQLSAWEAVVELGRVSDTGLSADSGESFRNVLAIHF